MARVLVIDDDEFGISAIKRTLETIGHHEVLTAFDGEAGLITAKKELPDVILLDVIMPNMDGYEVLKELRSDQNTLHIPVIILTAVHDEQSIKQAVYEYNADYIVKPCETSTLLSTITHALTCKE